MFTLHQILIEALDSHSSLNRSLNLHCTLCKKSIRQIEAFLTNLYFQFQVYTSSITISAPETFQPVPVEEKAAPKPQPPAVPPKPFKDTRVFQNVDTHAVEVSKEEHKSFKDLVWHLIYARNITNELEKARAIFLWLCSKV